MTKKKMTIEDLAGMTQRGFTGIRNQIKEEVGGLRNEMKERFDEVDKRFDRMENVLIRAHDNRIERLEDDVREIKTSLKK